MYKCKTNGYKSIFWHYAFIMDDENNKTINKCKNGTQLAGDPVKQVIRLDVF